MTIEDLRRQYSISENKEEALQFAAEHWIGIADESIQKRGKFCVALSGGSTPRELFNLIVSEFKDTIDWSLVWFFWSDERTVGPDHNDSNYKMALDHLLSRVPVNMNQVFRIKGEEDPKEAADQYEKQIVEHVKDAKFDLIMLGVGEDGHTASLFPETNALKVKDAFVVSTFVEKMKTHRITFTFPLINHSRHAVVYAFGDNKAEIVERILKKGEDFPAHQVGIPLHPALWILDAASGSKLTSGKPT